MDNKTNLSNWIQVGIRWIANFRRAIESGLKREGIVEIALYGTGETALLLIRLLSDIGVKIEGIYHENPEVERFGGYPVRSLKDAKKEIPMLIASSQDISKLALLKSRIASLGVKCFDLSSLCSDGISCWLKVYDLLPPEFGRIILESQPEKYWDEYGLRWARKAHRNIHSLEDGSQGAVVSREIIRLKPTSILEVGCGAARMLQPVRKFVDRDVFVAGVDMSDKLLAVASKLLLDTHLVRADMTVGLPFQSKSFDLIYIVAVLQHLSPSFLEDVMKEFIRVSRGFVMHFEYRWPGARGTTYDHDLKKWYIDRGFLVTSLNADSCNCFPDEPDRMQFFYADISSTAGQAYKRGIDSNSKE